MINQYVSVNSFIKLFSFLALEDRTGEQASFILDDL